MLRILILSFFIVGYAQASHLDDVCNLAYRSGQNSNSPMFDNNLMARRDTTDLGTQYVIETLNGDKIFSDLRPIKDFVVKGNSIWILNSFELLEINFKGDLLGRYPFEEDTSSEWFGYSFSMAGDIILIAQGLGGMTAFDTNTRKVIWHNLLEEAQGGTTISVATDGVNGYAVMTPRYENGFTGITIFNPRTGEISKILPYKKSSGVISVEAKASWYNDSLVLSNGGWIHVMTRKQLEEKELKPRWVPHVINANGEVNPHYMLLTGEFFFENKELVGCGIYTAKENGLFVRKSSLYKVPMPY